MVPSFQIGLLALPVLAGFVVAQNTTSNNLQYVNQLIGSNNGGLQAILHVARGLGLTPFRKCIRRSDVAIR